MIDLAGVYLSGAWAGYQARCAEEAAEWVRSSKSKVFVAAGLVDRVPFAEREAERLAVIREAHGAGLHEPPVAYCASCKAEREHRAGVHEGRGFTYEESCALCKQEVDVLWRIPHNGNYGVPPDGICVQPKHGFHASPFRDGCEIRFLDWCKGCEIRFLDWYKGADEGV